VQEGFERMKKLKKQRQKKLATPPLANLPQPSERDSSDADPKAICLAYVELPHRLVHGFGVVPRLD
jgi:hypothetical protein